MTLAALALLIGLILLVWSAERFVDGAAATACHFKVSPLIIGMVVVGVGTSAPEMAVSSLAAWEGRSGIALGNAYGSNITNITLILGLTALMRPIAVHAQVIRREMPILLGVTALAAWQMRDLLVSRLDAAILLGIFALLMLRMWQRSTRTTNTADDTLLPSAPQPPTLTIRRALFWVVCGLLLLLLSSRLLVWGAIGIARYLGVDDLLIGLTIVALGTSLPELASSIVAARRGENDIALGNIIGSNFFNTLAVVGLAALVRPLQGAREILLRDITVMSGVTLLLFAMVYGFPGAGRINRLEGGLLIAIYLAYSAWLIAGA